MRKNSAEANEEEVLVSKQAKALCQASSAPEVQGGWETSESRRKAKTRPRGPHRQGQDSILNFENDGKPPKGLKQQNENAHC